MTRILRRVRVAAVFVAAASLSIASPLSAQQPPGSGGSIRGEVTAQSGVITLGGVQVLVFSGETRVANVSSEADGRFAVENLPPGEYRVSALLDGFQPLSATASVVAGQVVELKLDLQLAETVLVTGSVDAVVSPTGTIAAADAVTLEEVEQFAPGGGLQGALRLLASVIEVPGGVAIKGGRPSQAGMQIGPGMFVDPATGLNQASLPDDAIDSITVLPNPYAVEFGRFSSGLVVVETRRGADRWRVRVNNLDPSFRTRRGEPLRIVGVQSFYPRAEIGGPLIKDRLFIQQSLQYRYRANDVPSRPPDELRTSHRFSSFTRLDANLSANHSLVALGGVFPSRSSLTTLGTFIPPDATVDMRNRVDTVAITERALLTETVFLETTGEINRYHTRVQPQGNAPMEVVPENVLGNFFNRQDRTTTGYQFVQTLTGSSASGVGLHLYKFGIDVLHNVFDAESESRPVLIRRSDGTLSRRLDFSSSSALAIRTTDLALFAQDRWQPNGRWYLEVGARLDHDGVVERFNVTPRIGTAILLNPAGSSVIRSGYGLFYERTPSAAGVFEQYESQTETRFAADGLTPLGPPELFRHVTAPDLRTSRSATWDVAFDHRFNPHWALHVGAIDRRGRNELIVDRVVGPSGPELRLDSSGRSRYRELELGVHFTGGPGADLRVSYVRAQARADLNAFTMFYDAVLAPVVGQNAFAPARSDMPHRLLARGRAMPTPNWLFTGVLDWRTGLPFSVVDEALDFTGPRNRERFPNYLRVDLGIERRIRLFSLRPWVGVRADNAFNAFLPLDVQANVSSPAFRDFYNSEIRQFRIQFRFER